MNVDFGKLLNYKFRKYEFLTMPLVGGQPTRNTNPSSMAGWPSGLTTMSVVGGQMNNIHPSCASCVES